MYKEQLVYTSKMLKIFFKRYKVQKNRIKGFVLLVRSIDK
jgi:hypothetical protein